MVGDEHEFKPIAILFRSGKQPPCREGAIFPAAPGEATQWNRIPLNVPDFDEIQTVCVFYKKTASQNFYLKKFWEHLYAKRII